MITVRFLCCLVAALLWMPTLWMSAASATAVAARSPVGEPAGRVWPVGSRPAVERGWEPPDSAYGPGHRGVDLKGAPGAPVRAVTAGRVSFAGRVAGRGVLSVALSGTGDPPLRTTYEPVEPLAAEGDEVAAGQVVARLAAAPSHCAAGCLHWGLLRGETYLNPLSLLPPELLRRPPSRLLPVSGVPEPPARPLPAALPPPRGASMAPDAARGTALLMAAALTNGTSRHRRRPPHAPGHRAWRAGARRRCGRRR